MARSAVFKFAVFLGLMILGFVVLVAQSFPIASAQSLPIRSGAFTIHLESKQAVYGLGEPIEVRVTVHNNTADHYAINAVPPWGLCKIVILNDRNEPVPSNGQYPYRWSMIDIPEYPPGKTVIITFVDPNNTRSFPEWASIKYWGYDIKRPGSYTLIALPEIRAFPRTGPDAGRYFITSEADKSNTVHIQIAGK